MNRALDRSIIVGLVLIVVVLVASGSLDFRNTNRLHEDAAWVAHTREVLDLISDQLRTLLDAETGERGFLITGKDEYLQPFDTATKTLDSQLATLQEKTSDNPAQQQRIQRLRELTTAHMKSLNDAIAARRRSADEAQALTATGKGKAQMDAIRQLTAEMEQAERDLLEQRQQQSRRTYDLAQACAVLSAVLGLVMVGAFYWLLRRRLSERFEATAVLREQEERLRTTLTSIGDGVIVTDDKSVVTLMNPVARDLTGWKDEAIGRPLSDVFHIINEQARRPVESPVSQVIREGVIVGLANHTALIARDGTERPIEDSAAPVNDAQGRVVGVVLVFRDCSERRRVEQSLRSSAQQLQIVTQSMAAPVTRCDRDLKYQWVSKPYADWIGRAPEEIVGRPIMEIVGQEALEEIRPHIEQVLTGKNIQYEEAIDFKGLGRRWISARYTPTLDATGVPDGWVAVVLDITERKRVEQSSQFLAEASASLSTVVDYASTLQKVAGLAVPFFADWCIVDMAEPDGSLRRLIVVHVDPEKVRLAEELRKRYPADPNSSHGAYKVLRTGESQLMNEIPDELLVQRIKDAERLRIIRELGLKSYIIVPLRVRGDVLGVLSFVTAESGRKYTRADLRLAEDLAHRAAIAIENARLYGELKETNRRKDDFLATLAHELRNPLAPLRNAVELIRLAEGDPAQVEQARGLMKRQLDQLVRLVDDLLDVNRINRGKVQLRKQPVELKTIIRSALESVQPLVQARAHELTVAMPSEPIYLDADSTRLVQVITNLLSNAAKFTEKRGQVWLTAERQGGEVAMSVRDTGVGIAPEQLPHLFEMFSQVAPALERSQGGLGIGLSLVKKLVELHGGRVEARSAGIGKGSEFIVRLSVIDGPAHHEAQQSTDVQQAAVARQWRVLAVDDNRDAADTLAAMLQIMGHVIRTAYEGLEAAQTAETFRPEVILLDIGMPKMNGYEVARHVRQQPWGKSVVLIALTGWGQEEDKRRAKEAGFDHHLTKPVDAAALEDLLATIKPGASVVA